MSLPKEPRQKMINMMYLVLTALLALNVSSEILNAFKTVKASLERSSALAETKNAQLFRSFEQKLKDPTTAVRAEIWLEKAKVAKKLSDDAYAYIESLKQELMKESGYNPPKDTILKEDNLDAATRLFVESAPEGKGKGKELLAKLTKLREDLLNVDTSVKAAFQATLPIDLTAPPTKHEGNKEWSAAYFRMTPTIAALTILSKFQNDIRNSEAQIVEFCHKKVGEIEIINDKFDVIATASSSYLMPDEELTIYAGLASYSSKAVPTITVDGVSATANPTDPAAPAQAKFKVNGMGDQIKKVTVSYVNPSTNKLETVTKEVKYTVGQPSGLTISTDKTRVFYAGLENELSVKGSGGAEQIKVEVSGAGATATNKGNGTYVVKCTQTGKATVRVTDKNGKPVSVDIPVKRVPDPVAKVGSKAGGNMTVSQFKAQQGVIAVLENFIFEGVKFDVTSFFIMFSGAGFPDPIPVEVNGNSFATVNQYKARCEEGTTIIIGNIKARGPEGVRSLDQTIAIVLE